VLFALLVALAAGLAGCAEEEPPAESTGQDTATSSPEDEADASTVEDIASSFRSSIDVLSEDEATCLAESLVDALGADRAQSVADADDLSSLDAEQRQSARTALNDCMSGAALAPTLATQFYQGLGTEARPTKAVTRCLAGELDGQAGDLLLAGLQAMEQGQVPAGLVDAYQACVPDEILIDEFASTFEADGASPEKARCVAEFLVDELSLAEITQIGMSGEQPGPEFQAVVQDAARACGVG
jgi:hypothetical protein